MKKKVVMGNQETVMEKSCLLVSFLITMGTLTRLSVPHPQDLLRPYPTPRSSVANLLSHSGRELSTEENITKDSVETKKVKLFPENV